MKGRQATVREGQVWSEGERVPSEGGQVWEGQDRETLVREKPLSELHKERVR